MAGVQVRGHKAAWLQVIREPAPQASEGALYPRDRARSERWTPTFELLPYRQLDPQVLNLGGADSFHDLDTERLQAAIRQVVDVEGPAHFDVCADAIAEWSARMARSPRRSAQGAGRETPASPPVSRSIVTSSFPPAFT